MAPCFFSCDGRGTSRRMPPVTGSREASCVAVGRFETSDADLEDEEEMQAAGAARMRDCGRVDVAVVLSVKGPAERCWVASVPLSALGAIVLDRPNMASTSS